MKIAVASGKGGTGKTTISTNLAATLSRHRYNVELFDCDVEEPNCHIFVKPEFESTQKFTVPVPHVDTEKCTGCGTCASVCEYNAITCLKGNVLVFPELCHGCGGCKLFCPENAIEEAGREVGVVETGKAEGFHFVQGRLHIGEVMSPPLIRGVKNAGISSDVTIIDSPPGTSCPVIEAVKDAEFVLLVTEPTPFGLNDLKLAVDMIRVLNIPFAVVINRCNCGDDEVKKFCQTEGIDVILEIPDDRRIAEAYSRGQMAVQAFPEYEKVFIDVYESIHNHVKKFVNSIF